MRQVGQELKSALLSLYFTCFQSVSTRDGVKIRMFSRNPFNKLFHLGVRSCGLNSPEPGEFGPRKNFVDFTVTDGVDQNRFPAALGLWNDMMFFTARSQWAVANRTKIIHRLKARVPG